MKVSIQNINKYIQEFNLFKEKFTQDAINYSERIKEVHKKMYELNVQVQKMANRANP